MSVNYEIWGSPETWVDSTTDEQYAGIKYPAADKDTYKEQYTSGGIPYNKLDETLAFWGIGKDCIFCNPQYIAPYCIGGDINTIDVYQEPVKQSKSAQPAIFSHGGPSSVSVSYTRRWSYYTAAEIEADTQHRIPIGTGYTEQLYAEMHYKKMMLVPYVETIADTYTTGAYTPYTLYDYIENQRYNTKQRIVGIGFMVRYGDGINADRSNENKSTSLLFSFDVPGKDLSYNNHQFYAHENGISTLLWSDGSGNCRVPMAINTGRISGNATIGTADTGFRAKYCPTNDGSSVPLYFYDPDHPIWTVNKTTAPGSGSTVFWYAYPYIAVNSTNAGTVKEYVLEQLAYLGLPFVYDPANAARGQIGDIGVYLPVFDENGITTGEYEEGINALRLPNADWVSGRESGYDPNVQPEGDLDNSTGRNLNFWASSRYYLMRQSDLDKFLSVVNGLYTGGETAEEKAEALRQMQVDFKGSNPADYIVGLYGLPFQWKGGYTAFQPVMLGPVRVLNNDPASDTAVELLNPDFNVEMLFGEIPIPALGNFMDYEPYTTLLLYVPFCGTVQLSCAEYIGQTVRVVGTLDKHTGDFTVRIMRNGLTVTNTLTGNLYVRVPITAQQMGDYQNNIHQLQMAGFNKMLGALTGAVTGGVSIASGTIAAGGEGGGGGMGFSPTAPISMAANLASLPVAMWDADFRITHCQPSIFYSSGASSANQAKFYTKAKLFIKRPVMLDSYRTAEQKALYAHTVGNACIINDTIGGDSQSPRSGLVKVSSVDLSGLHTANNNYPPTLAEQNLIKQSLMNGVYV